MVLNATTTGASLVYPYSMVATNTVSGVWTPFAGYLTVAYQVITALSPAGLVYVSADLILKA